MVLVPSKFIDVWMTLVGCLIIERAAHVKFH